MIKAFTFTNLCFIPMAPLNKVNDINGNSHPEVDYAIILMVLFINSLCAES